MGNSLSSETLNSGQNDASSQSDVGESCASFPSDLGPTEQSFHSSMDEDEVVERVARLDVDDGENGKERPRRNISDSDAYVEQQLKEYLEDDIVPVNFIWPHPAEEVSIQGNFNDWAEGGTPMRKNVNDFSYLVELQKSNNRYAYQYIVDGEITHNMDDPNTILDREGYVNNFVDVSKYKKQFNKPIGPLTRRDEIINQEFNTTFDLNIASEWDRKKPPELPTLLSENILLNKVFNEPRRDSDRDGRNQDEMKIRHPDEVPVPTRETLNHMCVAKTERSCLTLCTTERYRDKYVTTILHMPSHSN